MLATKTKNEVLRILSEGAENMAYTEFVDKVKNNEIGFDIQVKNKYRSLQKPQKFIFYFLVVLYTLVPLVFIPFCAYKYENWHLLFGLLISAIASMTSSRGFVVLLLLYTAYCVHGWFQFGFYCFDLFTFYAICGWWGYTWASIADAVEEAGFSARILQDEKLYNACAEQNAIIIY